MALQTLTHTPLPSPSSTASSDAAKSTSKGPLINSAPLVVLFLVLAFFATYLGLWLVQRVFIVCNRWTNAPDPIGAPVIMKPRLFDVPIAERTRWSGTGTWAMRWDAIQPLSVVATTHRMSIPPSNPETSFFLRTVAGVRQDHEKHAMQSAAPDRLCITVVIAMPVASDDDLDCCIGHCDVPWKSH
ncbi:unnamed protein product [Mycena citricolor]|uniref:Uncharacterized protein n=1 Tax=Mycena citricolor TaxID=2018698 RepID=A0AAD2GR87_9AGAR|nr:unnamed protein product [Mycena citricolor]